jgi:subtilisin
MFPLGLALVALWMLGIAAPAGAADKASYIVVYRGSVDSVDRETDKHERAKGFRAKFRYRHAVKGFAAQLTEDEVQELESDPDVAFVSLDRTRRARATIVPGDTAPTGVRRMEAAVGSTVRGPSRVNVAVLDTGIDLDHPDLNAVDGKDCIPPITTAEDDDGHGTHVAGSIAARNNGSGVVGVAPGTKIYAVKVLDSKGEGTDSTIICGLDWAKATRSDGNSSNDIAVINMSLGGPGPQVRPCATTTDAFHRAVCNATAAGIVNAVAAGNEGWDFDFQAVPDVPAAYPETIAVTAMSDFDGAPGGNEDPSTCEPGEQDDVRATFSSFAARSENQGRTLAGPGICIHSTYLNGGYATESGTSMATPHVAGAVALCLGEGTGTGPCAGLPANQPSAFVQKITKTDPSYGYVGDPNQPISGRYYGYLVWGGVSGSSGSSPYRDAVMSTPGLVSYWRLGEGSGSTAVDQKGANQGAYQGSPTLSETGAIAGDPDKAVRFDGQNDEMTAPGPALSTQGSIEGWFYWEAGVALLRDNTTAGGWILAYDSGGQLAYRVGGTSFLTGRTTASLKNGWHHLVLTRSGGSTAFYVDGALVHQGSGGGTTPAKPSWHLMRNGAYAQYSRGRADELAIYNTALSQATVRHHYNAGS